MAGACPVPAPGDPLVDGLLATTDCHVQLVVRTGYGALFEGGGGFSAVLTVLLTIYVALIGYRLLLGRGQLNVSDLALTAAKIGAVAVFATQWGTYQAVVYRLLFDGPQELANALLRSLGAGGAVYHGDVFTGLQHAFDDLTAFSPATPPGTPQAAAPVVATGLPASSALPPVANQASTLLSKAGFDSVLLLSSAVILLLSSLGVLLASKIVLALLLALGPVFIAMLLFDSTRGLFEGWLRASLGFAFAPLATTLLLGLALSLLGPSLAQIEAMRDANNYTPGVAFAVLILVLVFAGVSAGLLLAAGVIAGGFRLPRALASTSGAAQFAAVAASPQAAQPGRAARVASAAVAQERRDATLFARNAAAAGAPTDRRVAGAAPADRARAEIVSVETRLGQETRRPAQPRAARTGARSGA